MTDLSMTIAPKSDQLNADDLIGGPRTIVITGVSADPSSAEQPVSIRFEEDNGKPYKPCKSMRRVMVSVWGKDGNAYSGRAMTIYRDSEVQFGGMKVGGIRISHMTDIEKPVTMALTATRASRKPFTVQPLKMADKPKPPVDEAKAAAANGMDALKAFWGGIDAAAKASLKPEWDGIKAIATAADAANAPDDLDVFGLPPLKDDTRALTAEEIDAQDAEMDRRDREGV